LETDRNIGKKKSQKTDRNVGKKKPQKTDRNVGKLEKTDRNIGKQVLSFVIMSGRGGRNSGRGGRGNNDRGGRGRGRGQNYTGASKASKSGLCTTLGKTCLTMDTRQLQIR
jgi:hypothetical protein